MTTLGQIVGIHKSTRTQVEGDWTATYHLLQKPDLYHGLDKTHEPYEGNLAQPAQTKRTQANATELLSGLKPMVTKLMDLTATKDLADTRATADVYVNGDVLLPSVPIAHLLWLEKKTTDLLTVFSSIPILSAAEDWAESDALPVGMRRTPTEEIPSTKKITKWEVIVPADSNGGHPADVREVSNDVRSGTWRTVKYTTALPPKDKQLLVARVTALREGIKQAIVAANAITVTDVNEGDLLFGYLYDGVINATA